MCVCVCVSVKKEEKNIMLHKLGHMIELMFVPCRLFSALYSNLQPESLENVSILCARTQVDSSVLHRKAQTSRPMRRTH